MASQLLHMYVRQGNHGGDYTPWLSDQSPMYIQYNTFKQSTKAMLIIHVKLNQISYSTISLEKNFSPEKKQKKTLEEYQTFLKKTKETRIACQIRPELRVLRGLRSRK